MAFDVFGRDQRHDDLSTQIANGFRSITQQLARINAKLDQISNKEATMAIDLTKITAEVANNTAVDASIEQLVQNLAAQIAAIPVSTDPATQAALDQLAATLGSNDSAIAAAVVANTPAAPKP